MNENIDQSTGEITPDKPPPRAPKSFLQTLAELQYGHFPDECTEVMREAITAVARTEKVATVTLQLKMKPGKGGQVEIFSEITNKLPKPDKASSLMFISPDLNLVRNDPRQMEIQGMRVVDATQQKAPVRVEAATPPVTAVRVA